MVAVINLEPKRVEMQRVVGFERVEREKIEDPEKPERSVVQHSSIKRISRDLDDERG